MPRIITRGSVRGRGTGLRGRGINRGGRFRAGTTKVAYRGRKTGRVIKRDRASIKAKSEEVKKDKIILNLDVNKDASEYFTKNATFDQHYDAQVENKEKYLVKKKLQQ